MIYHVDEILKCIKRFHYYVEYISIDDFTLSIDHIVFWDIEINHSDIVWRRNVKLSPNARLYKFPSFEIDWRFFATRATLTLDNSW